MLIIPFNKEHRTKSGMEISVIIPTFKPKEYLLECLLSLKNQTLLPVEYEIIIILNGEKEPYHSKIISWMKGINIQAKLIYTKNKGVSNARNIGIDYSRGKFLAFIDDDDYVSRGYLKSLLQCILSSSNKAIACSDVRTINSKIEFGYDYISRAYKKFTLHPNNNGIIARRSFLSTCWGKLIPRTIIGNRRFLPNLKIGEDVLFMATISNSISQINLSDKKAIYYRRLKENRALDRNYTLQENIKLKMYIIKYYVKIYFKEFPNYNLLFLLSRIFTILFKW